MVGKKGWMRTIEVTIAVFIVAGFVFAWASKSVVFFTPFDYGKTVPPILEELAKNKVDRKDISNSENVIQTELNNRITDQGLKAVVEICLANNQCVPPGAGVLPSVEKEVRAYDYIIADQEPAMTLYRIRAYVWMI